MKHRGVKNDVEETAQSNSAWKDLARKLDQTQTSKERFGKIEATIPNGKDELQCKHFAVCGGCSVKENFDDTTTMKRARSFFAASGVDMKIKLGPVTAWRTHVKLAVQPLSKWGGLKIGLYRTGSHNVESIPECRVHHPRINEAVSELHKCAVEAGVKGYAEATAKGLPAHGELRYVQMSMDRVSGRIQLTLVWNALSYRTADQSLVRLVKKLKANAGLWHSVTANFHTSDSNVIFNYDPKAWNTLWGPPILREKVGNASFYFQPQIFRQVGFLFFVLDELYFLECFQFLC